MSTDNQNPIDVPSKPLKSKYDKRCKSPKSIAAQHLSKENLPIASKGQKVRDTFRYCVGHVENIVQLSALGIGSASPLRRRNGCKDSQFDARNSRSALPIGGTAFRARLGSQVTHRAEGLYNSRRYGSYPRDSPSNSGLAEPLQAVSGFRFESEHRFEGNTSASVRQAG